MAKKRGTLSDPLVDGLIEAFKAQFECIILHSMIEAGPVEALKNIDSALSALQVQRNALAEKADEYTKATVSAG